MIIYPVPTLLLPFLPGRFSFHTAAIWLYAPVQPAGAGAPLDAAGRYLYNLLCHCLSFAIEGLWDMTLWKEHTGIFGIFHRSRVAFSDTALCFIVPLLALPQITHYLIDGFIWKIKRK